MTFAFDIGGTLTKYPHQLWTVMECLRLGGHRVMVLSANITGSVDEARWVLRTLGHNFDAFEVCAVVEDWNGTNKGNVCLKNSVDLMVDDATYNMDGIPKISPATALLKIN